MLDEVPARPVDHQPEDARPLQPPPPTATTRVPVTVRVDEALWKRTRIRAIDEDRTASAVVGDALLAYLAGPSHGARP